MEIVSGVASSAQLLAYSHSTLKVLFKLYKQLRDGPASHKHQQSSILVLLSVVDGLQRRPAPTHILTTLLELSKIATEALNLITQSQRKGFLGLSWSAVHHEQLLSEVFASLKDKREVLHLAISVESMSSRPSSDSSSSEHDSKAPTEQGKMRLRDWKFWRSIRHTDTGSNNKNIIGNGPMGDRGVTRIRTNISGNGGYNYIGNEQDFSLAQHYSRPSARPGSHGADEPPQEPQHGSERYEFSEPYFSDADPVMPANHLIEANGGSPPPVPGRNPARGRAITFEERPVELITAQSRQWNVGYSSSDPSSSSEVDSPSSLDSSAGLGHSDPTGRRGL